MNAKKLLHISYWMGAITDLLFAIAMLYVPMLAGILRLPIIPNSLATKLALDMGASLMFGWTVLLMWGDRKPFERKGILLITILPVIAGLVLTTLYGYLSGFIPFKGAIPIWVLQIFLITLFLVAYFYANKVSKGNNPLP
jgi:hypothetical protein